jgi:ubiquinone biosynthesis protein
MSLVKELRKLQDDVPPFETELVKKTIEGELHIKIEEVFKDFDYKPIAAASIAQVHRAELKTGEKVVIKVQRPGIRRVINTDLDILRGLAEFAEERVEEVRRFRPVAIVDEFTKSINKEIDFNREAHNIKRFKKNFEEDDTVYVPEVFDEYSTEKVLTMEYIDGIKLDSEEIRSQPDLDTRVIVERGIRFMLTQTLVHGFFHADPHPGNIFILPDNVICLLDFGMMGLIDQEQIDDLLHYLTAILTRNVDRMIRLYQKLELIDETVDMRALRLDILDLLDRYMGVEITKINMGVMMQDLFDVAMRYNIVLPADMMLMGKALATIDGVARDVCPEIDPMTAMRPFIIKLYMERISDPAFFARDFMRAAEEALFLIRHLPKDLRLLLKKLRQGDLQINVKDAGRAEYLKERNRAQNRLASSVLIGSLILSSVYAITHPVNYLVRGMDLTAWLGIAGFVLAGMIGLGLSFGFLRSGGQ